MHRRQSAQSQDPCRGQRRELAGPGGPLGGFEFLMPNATSRSRRVAAGKDSERQPRPLRDGSARAPPAHSGEAGGEGEQAAWAGRTRRRSDAQ